MKNLIEKIIGIGVILAILLSNVVMAATRSELQSQQTETKNRINSTQKELEEVQAEKSSELEQVQSLNNKISEYQSQIDELNNKISDLNNQINEAQSQLDQAQEDFTKQEELLKNRLIATYEAGETTYLDVLLRSSNLIDFISNYFFVSELVNTDTEFLESIKEQKQKIEDAKQELETSKNELDTAKSEKEEVSGQLKVAKSEKDNQVQQLTVDEKKIQEQIDELKKDNQAIDAKMAEARKKLQDKVNSNKNNTNSGSSGSGSSSNGSSGGGSSSGGAPTGPSSSGFIYPVPSGYTRITTGLYYSSGQYHGAVDFGSGGISGQPVYAVADGVVLISENLGNRSYGNYIIIEHYNGLFTLYAHGQDGSRAVSVGDEVKQGQQIMRVGSTGNSTGPHLHFEVRNGSGGYNNRIDPRPYLP